VAAQKSLWAEGRGTSGIDGGGFKKWSKSIVSMLGRNKIIGAKIVGRNIKLPDIRGILTAFYQTTRGMGKIRKETGEEGEEGERYVLLVEKLLISFGLSIKGGE